MRKSVAFSMAIDIPPHSRGWTRRALQFGLDARVSPALAGMDPHRAGEGSQEPGFPRTRGDGLISRCVERAPPLPFRFMREP